MRSPGVGAQITGMPSTIGVATTFTGTTTFNKTAASGSETIYTAKVSDDATSLVTLENAAATDGLFVPLQRYVVAGANPIYNVFQGTSDTGSAAIGVFRFRIGTGTIVSTRPLFDFQGGAGASLLTGLPLNSGANLALSWGTQGVAIPAFTTRAAGTRAVWYSTISASAVDFATGVASGVLWHSIPEALSTYAYRIYAGTTNVFEVRGDGKISTTGAQVHKARVATTTPVTVAAGTDYKVVTRLSVAGAVAVNLPASPSTGQVFIIQDGTGDAASNNITITPAAGTINGAATKVISTNYGAVVLEYDGTTWLAR